jgi:hypothetical protein
MEGQRPQVGPAFSVVRNRVRCKPQATLRLSPIPALATSGTALHMHASREVHERVTQRLRLKLCAR